MKKLLFVGGSGGLGTALIPMLDNAGYEILSPSSSLLPLQDQQLVKEYLETHRPNIVIHSAVRNYDSVIHKTDPITTEIQIENNNIGFVNLLRHSLSVMREQKYGRIIYFSSVLSRLPIHGTGIYAACKSFNETLIRTSALENTKYGITCNTIRLGYMTEGIIKDVPKDVLEKVIESIPLKRLGRPEEIFNAITFLINTEYMTGTNIDLSGGLYGG